MPSLVQTLILALASFATRSAQAAQAAQQCQSPGRARGGDGRAARWKYDLSDAMGKNLLFFEAQRAGELPGDSRVPWRGHSPGCHGASCEPNDGALTGGWYDAGDHVKFMLPMTYSAAKMGMALWRFGEVLGAMEWEGRSHWSWMERELRFVMDFLKKGHPEPRKLLAQVGDGDLDHAYMGRAEHLDMPRPVWWIHEGAPGPDLAASYAAAFAQCHLAFKSSDEPYAADCLQRAFDIMDWVMGDQGAIQSGHTYFKSVPNAEAFYHSSGIAHEVGYAAATLFAATGDDKWAKVAAENLAREDDGATKWGHKKDSIWAGWDNVFHESVVLLMMGGADVGALHGSLDRCLRAWIDGTGEVKVSPAGGRWVTEWGSNRYIGNVAGLAIMARDVYEEDMRQQLECFAVSQVFYLLGDAGHSMMVGFGNNPPKKPHHRNAACTLEESGAGQCDAQWGAPRDSPNTLNGAVVGGPKEPNDVYVDDRNDYIMSEVATDYNAFFTVALAGVMDLPEEWWVRYEAGACGNGNGGGGNKDKAGGGSGKCGGSLDQCGGKGFGGATCCKDGLTCKYANEWWSDCQPN